MISQWVLSSACLACDIEIECIEQMKGYFVEAVFPGAVEMFMKH